MLWRHRRGQLSLTDAPAGARVMAIVNLTPDSFSDGGRFVGPADVIEAVGDWVVAGAEIVDLGGESTRPGSEPVPPDEEQARVVPAIAALRDHPRTAHAVLSVDTRHATTAEAALLAGADVVNDVSGLADPDMAAVVARHGAGLVIGHMRGTPATMMDDTGFEDPFDDVAAALTGSMARAVAAGVDPASVVVDPCLGFGKSAAHSAAWIWWPGRLEAATGRPVLIGASRKRFVAGAIEAGLGGPAPEPSQRLAGSVAAAVLAMQRGARVLRVHDVTATLEARAVAAAVSTAAGQGGRGGFAAAFDRGRAARPVERFEPPRLADAVVAWAGRLAGLGRGGLLVLAGHEDVAALVPGRPVADEESPDLVDRDGAIVVGDARTPRARLARIGEILPLAEGPLPPPLGLRHRAAAGLTARCDALAVVVSETRGTVRVVHAGRVGEALAERELGACVQRWIETGEPTGGETR